MDGRKKRPAVKRRKRQLQKEKQKENDKRSKELRKALRKATKQIPRMPGGGDREALKIMKTNFSGDKGIRRPTPKGAKRKYGFGIA